MRFIAGLVVDDELLDEALGVEEHVQRFESRLLAWF